MKFIKFQDESGTDIYINMNSVVSIQAIRKYGDEFTQYMLQLNCDLDGGVMFLRGPINLIDKLTAGEY